VGDAAASRPSAPNEKLPSAPAPSCVPSAAA